MTPTADKRLARRGNVWLSQSGPAAGSERVMKTLSSFWGQRGVMLHVKGVRREIVPLPSSVSDRANGLHFVPIWYSRPRSESDSGDVRLLLGLWLMLWRHQLGMINRRDATTTAPREQSVERAYIYVFIIVFGFTAKNYYDSSVLVSDIYECKCLVYNRSI